MRLLKRGLFVPIDSSTSLGNRDYKIIRDQTTEWERTPSLHSTSMLLTSLQCLQRHHVLLFLLCSDLTLVSPAQWQVLMPKLRKDTSPCLRHPCNSPCNLECFMELISFFLLQEGIEDLDPLVLTQLFDAACGNYETLMSSTLSDLPTLLAYLASVKFVSRDPSRSSASASNIMSWISSPSSWGQSPRVDPVWFQAWRHAAYVCRLQAMAVYAPMGLIDSAFGSADQHAALPPFEVPSPLNATLRAMLVPEDDADRLVPSIWHLIATEKNGFAAQTLVTAKALATALCTISRDAENVAEFATHYFSPLKFRDLLTQMYFVWPRESDNTSPVFPTRALTLCSHIMELRSSWWIEGLNLLCHEDESFEIMYLWYGPVSVSEIQSYAAAITEECLRRGPCCNCPLTMGPVAFDISLRTFAVYPFAVYPEVEIDNDV